MMWPYIRETREGCVLEVKAAPNSGKNALAGTHNGRLKVKVAAVPEKGKANTELESFLSDLLGMARSRIHVVKGQAAREKSVLISGIKRDELINKLEEADGRLTGKNKGSCG